ncbi:MAG: SRPBCC family protein [Nocardioides sp.]
MSADRELTASVQIAAPVEKVWAVLTDFRNLADASPELLTMRPMLRGGLRVGQQYVGVNKRGWVYWPTTNVIVDLKPKRSIAWDTPLSGARWIFELSEEDGGTRLTQRRPVPKRLHPLGRAFAATLLGGSEGHADELEQALGTTLTHLKAVAEA